MSWIKDLESDVAKAEATIASWWGGDGQLKFVNVVGTGVTIAGTALETFFQLEGNGAAAAFVGNIVSEAQQKLAAVKQVVTSIGPTLSAKSVLQGVSSSLSQIDSVIGIKNPKSIASLNLATATINNLISSYPNDPTLLPTPTPAPTPAAA